MRRTLSLLISTAAAVGLYASLAAAPASAVLGCPDGMVPAHESFVVQGNHKDQNGNDVVCVKPTTCVQPSGPICHGGPDDDEIIGGQTVGEPLFGDDDEWYYVIDDIDL